MAIKTRWFEGSLALTAALAACSESVIEATTAGATSSTGATSTTGATGSGGASAGTTGSTGTGTTTGACGDATCTANQICVRPACKDVLGEVCIFGAPDGGEGCPPGSARGPQFDNDCVQPGFACVSGCPPAPPLCVDLPAGCGGVASCACLAMDPCLPSNSGACHDADISSGVLSCSLEP